MVHSIFCCERDYSISLVSLLITKNRAIKIQATLAETGYEEGKGEKSAKKAVFSEFLFSNILVAPSIRSMQNFFVMDLNEVPKAVSTIMAF